MCYIITEALPCFQSMCPGTSPALGKIMAIKLGRGRETLPLNIYKIKACIVWLLTKPQSDRATNPRARITGLTFHSHQELSIHVTRAGLWCWCLYKDAYRWPHGYQFCSYSKGVQKHCLWGVKMAAHQKQQYQVRRVLCASASGSQEILLSFKDEINKQIYGHKWTFLC